MDLEVFALFVRGNLVRLNLVRLSVLALAVTLLVPVGQVEVTATPVTLTEEVDGLPSVDGSQSEDADDDGISGFGTASADDADDAATSTSEIVEAPLTFSSVGVRAPESATEVRIRVSEDGETWANWQSLEFLDATDGPDQGTEEDQEAVDGQHTAPLWAGEASYIQLEVDGADTEDLDVSFIDSMGHSGGPVEREWSTDLGGSPADASELDIVSRAEWGADESLGSKSVSLADEVHTGIVHHTAHRSDGSANTYSRAEAPGIMRSMYSYHTRTLGWKDLGYNVVVDRFGTVYEGRRGGFERGVIGAHAAGNNTGSFGVSVIGNFVNQQASQAALDAVTAVIAAKSEIHDIDPTGWTDKLGAGGTWRPTIIGHRDVGQTSCPGRIQNELDNIRADAAAQVGDVDVDYENVIEDQLDYGDYPFRDVASTSAHRAAIGRLYEAGVTTGCASEEFCPGQSLSRAQASAFVVRALELDPIPGSNFPDVPSHHAHAGPINALVERGWMQGYPDGTFRPAERMTRAQLSTLLSDAADVSRSRPSQDPYPDVPRDHVHASGIDALKRIEIHGNCGSGNFCPDDEVLRDSTASFVDMVRHYRQEQGLSR